MVIQKLSGGQGGIFMAPRLIYNKYYLLSLLKALIPLLCLVFFKDQHNHKYFLPFNVHLGWSSSKCRYYITLSAPLRSTSPHPFPSRDPPLLTHMTSLWDSFLAAECFGDTEIWEYIRGERGANQKTSCSVLTWLQYAPTHKIKQQSCRGPIFGFQVWLGFNHLHPRKLCTKRFSWLYTGQTC